MSIVRSGTAAPPFTLANQHGEMISLDSFKGKKNVVVYFYPKASTPGCTVQACGVRDSLKQFADLDTVILGISPDPGTKLQKFVNKYDLNFDLLADENHKVAELYGVWGLKKFMGREFMGILRTSVLIDKLGNVVHVMEKVNTKTHAQDMLAILKKSF